MSFFLIIWSAGAALTLWGYFLQGRDRYSPHWDLNIKKPYRMLFRDWSMIIFAWPVVALWALFIHVKRYW